MKSCSQCHSLIPDDAGFCPECGAKQPAQQQQINPQSGAQQGPSAQQQSQQYVQMAQSFAQTGAQTAQQLSQQFFAQVGSMMRWEKMAYIGLGMIAISVVLPLISVSIFSCLTSMVNISQIMTFAVLALCCLAGYYASEEKYNIPLAINVGLLLTFAAIYCKLHFAIADFFDKDKVKDLTRDDTPKADEANFVGGGVVYYSMNGVTESSSGTPYSKAVDAGYVNSDGTINADEVKAMLKRNIEANYSNYASLAAAVGEEDAMKVVYGQAIPVTNNTENDVKTGVLYRYLPLENYSVDANNNITTTLNSDVFRYSNSLQSYQYVYASGNENKATNNGKNMRLYSYFIYSYLSYDKDTNLPQTKYEVVLSDQYSDASTYWAGNSN